MARAKLEDWLVAHHYVGRFIWNWANLETALHEAMQNALDLDAFQTAVLMANIQLRDKLNILKTLLDAYDHEAAPGLVKILNAIGTYSVNRNMMAHDFHGPMIESEGDFVRFYTIKAKGKFDMPKNHWTDKDFEAAYDKIEGFRKALIDGMAAFTYPLEHPAEPQEPTQGQPEPETADRPRHPLQSPPDSSKATPRKAPRKRKAPPK